MLHGRIYSTCGNLSENELIKKDISSLEEKIPLWKRVFDNRSRGSSKKSETEPKTELKVLPKGMGVLLEKGSTSDSISELVELSESYELPEETTSSSDTSSIMNYTSKGQEENIVQIVKSISLKESLSDNFPEKPEMSSINPNYNLNVSIPVNLVYDSHSPLTQVLSSPSISEDLNEDINEDLNDLIENSIDKSNNSQAMKFEEKESQINNEDEKFNENIEQSYQNIYPETDSIKSSSGITMQAKEEIKEENENNNIHISSTDHYIQNVELEQLSVDKSNDNLSIYSSQSDNLLQSTNDLFLSLLDNPKEELSQSVDQGNIDLGTIAPSNHTNSKIEKFEIKEKLIISNTNLIPNFEFPETKLLEDKGKYQVGIAFSGGGARSASCTLGQLRGLHKLGLIEKTRYFSCVSGSSWAIVPFLYGKVPRDFFLGVYPEDGVIEWNHIYSNTTYVIEYLKFQSRKWQERLNAKEEEELETRVVTENSSSTTIFHSNINNHIFNFKSRIYSHFEHHYIPKLSLHFPNQLENLSLKEFMIVWKANNFTYANILQKSFVSSFDAGDGNHFFTWCKEHVQDILNRNPETLTENDFVSYTNDSDPFLIVNACMLNLQQLSVIDRKSYIEFTPLYVGCSKLYMNGLTNDGKDSPAVGGCYIEPFCFNANQYINTSNCIIDVPVDSLEHRLNLGDIIASTSAAPAQEAAQRGLSYMFPKFNYWTPWKDSLKSNQETNQEDQDKNISVELHKNSIPYSFGDGGLLENTGMMGLLKRGMKRIIVFLNTKAPIIVNSSIITSDFSEDLSLPFGPIHYDGFLQECQMRHYSKKRFFNYYPLKLKIFRTRIDYEMNHVFEDLDGSNYRRLAESLYVKRIHGQSTMHEDEYTVLNNDFYGIKGGWKVRVLWVYNDVYKEFEDSLSPLLHEFLQLRRSGSDFVRYPHYKTAGENLKAIAALKSEQINLLSFQHTFNILNNQKLFLDFFENSKEEPV